MEGTLKMAHETYQDWHLDLGHSEYRITVTMAGYGSDPDDGEAFLEGFLDKCPEIGPVITQDLDGDTIAVTFSVHATNSNHANQLADVAWSTGGPASGLPFTEIVRVETERVGDHEITEASDGVFA